MSFLHASLFWDYCHRHAFSGLPYKLREHSQGHKKTTGMRTTASVISRSCMSWVAENEIAFVSGDVSHNKSTRRIQKKANRARSKQSRSLIENALRATKKKFSGQALQTSWLSVFVAYSIGLLDIIMLLAELLGATKCRCWKFTVRHVSFFLADF